MKPAIIFVVLSFATVKANTIEQNIISIAQKVAAPKKYLKEVSPLIHMGNSNIKNANIIFLPEIHDDPQSLLTQLLIMANERKNNNFLILDESLNSMKKSTWDVFSQKSLEILAALEQKQKKSLYNPKSFEKSLNKIAQRFKNKNKLFYHRTNDPMWTLVNFFSIKTPFFGWDIPHHQSLVKRNIKMVQSINNALKENNRILVMLGARHVPELEYITSKDLLCSNDKITNIHYYFKAIEKNFGHNPKTKFGIGATLPIFNFLKDKKYAIIFDDALIPKLKKVISNFQLNHKACLALY